eukprot:3217034-Rhodomonas_salina.1
MHYMIDVQSLKVGGHELLQFKDESIAIQAILDSGMTQTDRHTDTDRRRHRHRLNSPTDRHSQGVEGGTERLADTDIHRHTQTMTHRHRNIRTSAISTHGQSQNKVYGDLGFFVFDCAQWTELWLATPCPVLT